MFSLPHNDINCQVEDCLDKGSVLGCPATRLEDAAAAFCGAANQNTVSPKARYQSENLLSDTHALQDVDAPPTIHDGAPFLDPGKIQTEGTAPNMPAIGRASLASIIPVPHPLQALKP